MRLHTGLVLSALSWQPIFALTIPQQQQHMQIPLQTDQQQKTRPSSSTVILAFTSGGKDQLKHAEIPTDQQIASGIDLPSHLDTLRIETMLNDKGGFVSLEELNKVMCRVVPRLSIEERAAQAETGVERIWPWFNIRDETISFTQSSSRWFLAGRAIQGFECL
ncbi:hypothetical protein ACEQ8H_000892 [Pleosporales sp. CAS-2024a]